MWFFFFFFIIFHHAANQSWELFDHFPQISKKSCLFVIDFLIILGLHPLPLMISPLLCLEACITAKKSVKIKQVHNKENAQALIWRHNEHDSVSNHQPHGCLLSRLFRHKSKKTSKLRVTGLCVGNSPGPVNSPHKGPVTRKMFPFDDVIMSVSIPWLHEVVLMKPKATFLPHTLSHFLLSYSVQKCRKYCLTFSVVLVPMRAFKLFRSMG